MTAETVAEKLAVVAPAATVTLAGTVTEALLLARLTLKPPVGAPLVRVAVQVSVAAPVINALLQVKALSVAAGLRVRAKVFDTLPDVAVSVAD